MLDGNSQRSPAGSVTPRDWQMVFAFWLFSYILQSIWGALVALDLGVVIDARRLVAVTAGAGVFAFALRSIRQRAAAIQLRHLIGAIATGGLVMFAIRVGIDQMWPDSRPLDRSLRWALAWTGYYGIWLLAVTRGPSFRDQRTSPGRSPGFLPRVYLEQLFSTKVHDRD